MTEERIHSITFSESDVIKTIRALGKNKGHGHDNILVRMIKLCTNSVAHPLTLIFQNSMGADTFATQFLPTLLAVCSLTYLKGLIEFSTMDYHLNLNKMVLVEIYFN